MKRSEEFEGLRNIETKTQNATKIYPIKTGVFIGAY